MNQNKLVIYHCHDTLSNLSTGVDSVTKVEDYIEQALKDNMTCLGISNHGNVFSWYERKCAIEKAGLKYLHGQEFYLTNNNDPENMYRDNYHVVLIAKNYDGFLELNRLSSLGYKRDFHYYANPRITFDELYGTSDNIIITSACLASPLGCEFNTYNVVDKKTKEVIKVETKRDRVFGDDDDSYNRMVSQYIDFMARNKDRCFLEVQHHNTTAQKDYNRYLLGVSEQTGIPLIAGTDTHCLDERHARGRILLQYRKDIKYPDEEEWDLTWKNYDSLIGAYKKQGVLTEDQYVSAIHNTVVMSEMVEPFTVDVEFKYPNVYDNPEEVLREHVFEKAKKHPYLIDRWGWDFVKERLEAEVNTFAVCKSANYILLQEFLVDWCKERGIHTGPGRGSCVGSLACYALGVTEIDPIKHNLIFSRFMSPARITLADIDIDISPKDRPAVEEFVVGNGLNLPKIESAVIMTKNTIELKGSIKDVCGGFYTMYTEWAKNNPLAPEIENPYAKYKKYDPGYAQTLSNAVEYDDNNHPYLPQEIKDSEPEICDYINIVRGTCTSLGVHASGKLVADRDIEAELGTCTSKDTQYPLTVLDMNELESLYWVKEDLLGLKNLGIINETCRIAGIDIITPDTLDLEDEAVWEELRWDTTAIFQFESRSANAFLRNFMSPETVAVAKKHNPNFRMIDWVSIANAALRPAAASYRNDLASGKIANNGWDEIDKLLSDTNGYLVYQEQIMQFLVKFCGYSEEESDVARRKIAHKTGTEGIIPEVKERFINTSVDKYGLDRKKAEEVIEPFLQIILDASRYAFNKSHAVAYSYLSYEGAYLRHYYPLEYITSALNIFFADKDKISLVLDYAAKNKVSLKNIKYGRSKWEYFFNKEEMAIYKGISSVNSTSESLADGLFELSKNNYEYFSDMLMDAKRQKLGNSGQIDSLIHLDFFSEFGNARELMLIKNWVEKFKYGDAKSIKKEKIPEGTYIYDAMEKYANPFKKDGTEAKSYTKLQVPEILRACEDGVKALGIDDFDIGAKMSFQQKLLGYVSMATEDQRDNLKYYIQSVNPAKRKDGKVWGTRVGCMSIGTGKEVQFTIPHNGQFNYETRRREESPIERCGEIGVGDIIYCKKYKVKKSNGRTFFNLLDYVIL